MRLSDIEAPGGPRPGDFVELVLGWDFGVIKPRKPRIFLGLVGEALDDEGRRYGYKHLIATWDSDDGFCLNEANVVVEVKILSRFDETA